MKVLAIADDFIPAESLDGGLDALREAGHEVEIATWYHGGRSELQEVNLQVEQHGCNAVELPDELQARVRAAEVVLTQFAPLGDDLIRESPDLKVIGVMRGGTENVSQAAAKERGVEVRNTPGRNARAVAEFTLGMILAEMRSIGRTHAAMVRGEWLKDSPYGDDVREVGGRTVGIVGSGAIGRLVVKFLTAMDADCLFFDPFVDEVPGATKVGELGELLERSDVVSLHARLTPDTAHMIDSSMLQRMRPGAVLVNTARSGLVDEIALLEALREGRITAALDAFDEEPLPSDSPFLGLTNVTLTPHLAGSTADAFHNTPKLLAARLFDEGLL